MGLENALDFGDSMKKSTYTCDLCGGEIITREDGQEFSPIRIKVSVKWEGASFQGHACGDCAKKLEAFLRSKPYEET